MFSNRIHRWNLLIQALYYVIHCITFLWIFHMLTPYNMAGMCDVKIRWSVPVTGPVVAQRVGRVIALLFHDSNTRRGWVVSSTPRLHFTPERDPVPIVQEAGWAPGLVWTAENLAPRWFHPRPSSPSQSLYQLSYLAHMWCYCHKIYKTYLQVTHFNSRHTLICNVSRNTAVLVWQRVGLHVYVTYHRSWPTSHFLT